MGPNLTGVLLPKITGPADVHAADAILTCLETELGLAGRRDDALPDPRERAARSAAPTRSRSRPTASRTWAARFRASATSSRRSASAGRATGTETLYIREKVLIDARAAGHPLPDQRHVGRRQRRPRRAARVARPSCATSGTSG